MPKELPIPQPAIEDPRSVEMIRAWIAEEGLHCSINVGLWEEHRDERHAWGILLADLVRHIANAHEQRYGRDRRETVKMVRDSFEQEMLHKTREHQGDFEG